MASARKSASVVFALLATAVASVATASCSSDDPATTPAVDGGADSPAAAALTPSNACTDLVDAIYGDPGALTGDPSKRGDVLKCLKDPDITKDALQAKIDSLKYAGKPLTSGAHVYRISYQTERGDAASTPSASSAIVYIPDTPRAATLPIVVAARGSRGQAPQCAVSRFDASSPGINDDAYRMVYPLVGEGYAVIMTDLAGYANFGAPKNPPSAYAQATDIARSTLDSGRALKKLFPALDDKVVIVGHSQGGHSALASLAFADSYGTAAPIVGVAVYAPLWLNQRAFGAVMVCESLARAAIGSRHNRLDNSSDSGFMAGIRRVGVHMIADRRRWQFSPVVGWLQDQLLRRAGLHFSPCKLKP